MIHRSFIAALLLLVFLPGLLRAQTERTAAAENTVAPPVFVARAGKLSRELPEAPRAAADIPDASLGDLAGRPLGFSPATTPWLPRASDASPADPFPVPGFQSNAGRPSSNATEPFHWKGLLLQSFAFDMLQNATRVITADQNDRHLLLNKPFWSDYWASLGQFNMGRWNDGDSFPVNYIGHPMQGAISGYIEVQNDPRGRSLKIARDRAYWNSRFRAFLWETASSTQWEIGPLGETGIFNQGGFTYPIQCTKKSSGPGGCENPSAKYTNNTGWVDFIITPTVGTLWLLGEDTIDRYLSDPLMAAHPNSFAYKLLRSSLNPPRSLSNMLRGRFPWYRDYEHTTEFESPVVERFTHALEAEPSETVDLHLFYSALSLRTNHISCTGCRDTTEGAGAEAGFRVRRYLDLITTVSVQPDASPISSLNIGGSLLTANFGIRSGYSGRYFALKASLAPGFASYSDTIPMVTPSDPMPREGRNFNFSAIAAVSGDLRFTQRLAFRATVEQMLIRYKSPERDAPGIGDAPRLSFLSHDNYINSTNWGVRVGPVLRF